MTRIDELKHPVRDLPNGGFVLVLDTGAVIDSQAEAMLQALHSRSVGGIRAHLETLKKRGAENFMKNFYVGYGHKSIGDCGGVTVFIEGVSMLAAKAIQDWRLYSGQEASTRYIDFSNQPFLNPAGTGKGNEILENWRKFYLAAQAPLNEALKKKYPIQEGEKESIYNKAIAARAFDITRGFLPAGASTNVAWHMNLRQFADELALLRHHPLEEVRIVSETVEEALQERFPESFGHKRYEKTEEYNKWWMQNEYYHTDTKAEEFKLVHNGINLELLKEYRDILKSRPAKTELPPFIAECGSMEFSFLLDFGSYRDLQRHRAVAQRMPLVSSEHGFEPWYLDSLPEDLKNQATQFLSDQEDKIKGMNLDPNIEQYYTAMGYKVPCKVIGDLKALVYLVELRNTRFVHPTLVKRALQMADSLEKELSDYSLKIYRDEESSRFDIKRGEHDIVAAD